VNSILGSPTGGLRGEAAANYQTLLVLGNGFIVTAVLWGWALASIIDHQLRLTAAVFALASVATLVGLIHSPLPSGALFWPWSRPSPIPTALAGSYGLIAAVCWLGASRAESSQRG